MRFLRLLLAGLIGVAVLVAGLLAAALVVLTGLVAYVVQLFRGRTAPAGPAQTRAPSSQPAMRTDDVIDV